MRRMVLNEVLGGRRNGFLKRERPHSAVEPAGVGRLARGRRGRAGRDLDGGAGAAAAAAGRGGAALLRGPVRGRDRRRARLLARDGEVAGLGRDRRPAAYRARPGEGGTDDRARPARDPRAAPRRRGRPAGAAGPGRGQGSSAPSAPAGGGRDLGDHGLRRGGGLGRRADDVGRRGARRGHLAVRVAGAARLLRRRPRVRTADPGARAAPGRPRPSLYGDLDYLDTDAVATSYGVVFYDDGRPDAPGRPTARCAPWSTVPSTTPTASTRRPRPTRSTRGSPTPRAVGSPSP